MVIPGDGSGIKLPDPGMYATVIGTSTTNAATTSTQVSPTTEPEKAAVVGDA